MHKALLITFSLTLLLSCGSDNKKTVDEGTALTTKELETVKGFRDYFKNFSQFKETDFIEVTNLNPTDFVQKNDTFLFESINFGWAEQFNESMISAYYESPAENKQHVLYSNSKMIQELSHYLKTDDEFEKYRYSIDRKAGSLYKKRWLYVRIPSIEEWKLATNFCFITADITDANTVSEDAYTSGLIKGSLFFVKADLTPIGKISIQCSNSDTLEYSTPNYDQDLHLSSSLSVDLSRNFIQKAEQTIQQLLGTTQRVNFKNDEQ